MRKYNVFYDESGGGGGGGGGFSGSVLYDTAQLSSAIGGMNGAYSAVASIFNEMAQNTFFSEGTWDCAAATAAKGNFDTIKGYCNQISGAYSSYTAFLQDAVDSDFTDVGSKIVSAIGSGGTE